MVIRVGNFVEACPPAPCLGAVCACAGGGFAGTAMPLFEATCEPLRTLNCNNGDELCTQCFSESGMNCIKIGLPGKSTPRDYFQESWTSRRPFLFLRISFPGRPIFIQLPPGCPAGSKTGGSKATRTCERKSGDGPIKCRLGDHRKS